MSFSVLESPVALAVPVEDSHLIRFEEELGVVFRST